MVPNILITGASGYIGGTVLEIFSREKKAGGSKNTDIPYEHLYAAVRSDAQAAQIAQYGVEPLVVDFDDSAALTDVVVSRRISVVFWLVDAFNSNKQQVLIRALAEVKKQTGEEVHFLHTSGAKLISSHVGYTDARLLDTDPGLYASQKRAAENGPLALPRQAVRTNNTVIELSETLGVHSYIYLPCIVYGEGSGFGNHISIQTVAVVKAALAAGAVYDVHENPGKQNWPVCHIDDTATLYLQLLGAIARGENPRHGKEGYYLASPGSVTWADIYAGVGRSLAQRGKISDAAVKPADKAAQERMAKGLDVPVELVELQLGGYCGLVAENGKKLGWTPKFAPQHIIETIDDEVALILKHI